MREESIVNLSEIKREHIQKYLITLYERGLNTKSVARHLSAIRTFHQYLMIERICQKNPCDLIESPKLSRDLPEILQKRRLQIYVTMRWWSFCMRLGFG